MPFPLRSGLGVNKAARLIPTIRGRESGETQSRKKRNNERKN
jgi:hypothetical protein